MKNLALYAVTALCVLNAPAGATLNYEYRPGEYALIEGGMAPDQSYAIAAHGSGSLGDEDFHIYLMAEPEHRKIGVLEEIKDILDTGPGAYRAVWSPGSRFVAISYRSERHVVIFNLYRIGAKRAYPIAGPPLTAKAGIGGDDINEIRDVSTVSWKDADHFHLIEDGTFRATASTAAKLGPVVKTIERVEGSKDDVLGTYRLEADCEIVGDRYKIVRFEP